MEQGSQKRSIVLDYCKKNNICEWELWKKIAVYGKGDNAEDYQLDKNIISRNLYREKIINLLPGAEIMLKYDFVDLLTIERIFLSRILTLLDWALSELLASPSKYYNPLHGEKVLDTLIDKLGEESGLLFEKAVIIPLRVVKDRYI
jgi:hypothetical protein